MLRRWTRSLWRTVEATQSPRRRRHACWFGLISIQRLRRIFDRVTTHRPILLGFIYLFNPTMFLRLTTSAFSWEWCSELHRLISLTSQATHHICRLVSLKRTNWSWLLLLPPGFYLYSACLKLWSHCGFVDETLFCGSCCATPSWNTASCSACTGCCGGWETRGQRWNGAALRNAATEETQFGAERAALLSPLFPVPPSHLTLARVHADTRTNLLNSRSQTHLFPFGFLYIQSWKDLYFRPFSPYFQEFQVHVSSLILFGCEEKLLLLQKDTVLYPFLSTLVWLHAPWVAPVAALYGSYINTWHNMDPVSPCAAPYS